MKLAWMEKMTPRAGNAWNQTGRSKIEIYLAERKGSKLAYERRLGSDTTIVLINSEVYQPV